MHNIRTQFFVPEGLYFLNHSVGCLPKSYNVTVERYFASWATLGAKAWDVWFEYIEGFKKNLAELLSAHPDEISPQVNTSSAVVKILGSLPLRKERKKILISENAFASIGFALGTVNDKAYTVEFISQEQQDHESILKAWDKKLQTDVQVIVITHIHSNDSVCYPVKKLVKMAKDRGIYTIVDITASIGISPIDVKEWSADFIVGSCVKWLCGGSGAGFLWANSEIITECRPKGVGWFAHKNPFEFNIKNFEYAEDAKRFGDGTPSVLPYVIAAESIRVFLTIGIEEVSAYNQKLCAQLIEGLAVLGIKINSPLLQAERGGVVVFDLPEAEKADAYFDKQHFWIDRRNCGFRIAPHIYNTSDEIVEVLKIISNFAQRCKVSDNFKRTCFL